MSRGTLVITGGGRGIGAATARLAAAAGWDLCLGFHADRARAEKVAADCAAYGVEVAIVRGDVALEMDVLTLFARAEEVGPVRGLVNNAGVTSPLGSLAELDSDDLEQVFAVNVFGAFLCAREAVRLMQRDGAGGAIVNVSSRAAVLGGVGRYVHYAASKAAVDTLTVGLAAEVAMDGIRVNAVRPGLIDTEIHTEDAATLARAAASVPMGRFGSADEVAEAVVWLLSEKASYLTGAIVDVGGGR